MYQIYIPTQSANDWRQLLADPDLHWKAGYSAHALAQSWEQAKPGGLPKEITAVFATSGLPQFQQLIPLLAIPEYHVKLPGGARASQNDLFVLLKDGDGELASMVVEGKVNEPFGPTLGEWSLSLSPGKTERLAFLRTLFGLPEDLAPTLRYQLFHRAASAVLEAQRFNARSAIMLIHSFSPDHRWFEDYQAFLALFGVQASLNQLHAVKRIDDIDFYCAWVTSSQSGLRDEN